jgi:hypothetical protein
VQVKTFEIILEIPAVHKLCSGFVVLLSGICTAVRYRFAHWGIALDALDETGHWPIYIKLWPIYIKYWPIYIYILSIIFLHII